MSTVSLTFTLKDYRSDNSAYDIKALLFCLILIIYKYKNYSIYEKLN
jgi:hypothetical protein